MKAKEEKGVTHCPVGTVLFREGEAGSKMYVIKSGRVRMTKKVHDTEIVIEDLYAGDFCGEIALLSEQARPASATVIEEATVIQIDAHQFENMLRSNADISIRMLKKMAKRLTEAQFRISNFALRKAKARLLHQLRAEWLHAGRKLTPVPDNLADVLGLEFGEMRKILAELVRDDIVQIDKKGSFIVSDEPALDRYIRYLELQDHFEFRQS